MPAVSEKQRRLFAIAEHEPGKLYKKKGLAGLSHDVLNEFSKVKKKKVKHLKDM